VEWFKSSDGAGDTAVMNLFNTKLIPTNKSPNQTDYCNCQHADEPVGNCTIRATVCAMFNSSQDVKSGAVSACSMVCFERAGSLMPISTLHTLHVQVSYQAWAKDLATGNEGHAAKYADPKGA
jgi:hypothetical protein